MRKLRSAIDGNRTYEIPDRHDPLYLMFDNDFHLGTATHWPEYLCYNLETDEVSGEIEIVQRRNINCIGRNYEEYSFCSFISLLALFFFPYPLVSDICSLSLPSHCPFFSLFVSFSLSLSLSLSHTHTHTHTHTLSHSI